MSDEIERGTPEPDALPARLILIVFAVTVIVTVLLIAWAWQVQVHRQAELRARPEAGRVERPTALPPPQIETRLFTNVDRAVRLKVVKEQQLSTYGWVDQPHGVVRIPIERAMDVMAGGAGQ